MALLGRTANGWKEWKSKFGKRCCRPGPYPAVRSGGYARSVAPYPTELHRLLLKIVRKTLLGSANLHSEVFPVKDVPTGHAAGSPRPQSRRAAGFAQKHISPEFLPGIPATARTVEGP